MDKHHPFPSWRYGPKGEAAVFESEADVPAGWHDHPSKHEKGAKSDSAASGTSTQNSSPAKTNEGKPADTDAHGHPFNPELHAATASKTKDGLWRMKVGVKRPDPLPGHPPLDL